MDNLHKRVNYFEEQVSQSEMHNNSPKKQGGVKMVYEEDEIEQQSKNSDMEGLHKELEIKQKQLDWQFKESELDFQKKIFPQWDQKNVINSPYTYTLIEDCIYVDEGAIITLQYHIFNQEQDHILLSEVCDDEDQIRSPHHQASQLIDDDQKFKKSKSKLNTDNYQNEGAHPMSIFKSKPINLLDNGHPFDHDSENFMTAEEKGLKKNFKIEGILCFWRSYVSGKMEKMCEKSFTSEMPFAYTRKGNMTLQVTNDKKVLHLTYISNYSDREHENLNDENNKIKNDIEVKILAWKIDVENCTFKEELHKRFTNINQSLKNYLIKNSKFIHLIRFIKLTASLRYLILTYNQQQNRIDLSGKDLKETDLTQTIIPAKQNTKKISRKYAIFDVISGNLLFDYGGCYQDLQANESNKKIHNLGIVIQDITYEPIGEDRIKSQVSQSDVLYKYQYKCSLVDEEISFFCAGEFVDWSENIKKSKKFLENIDDQESKEYEFLKKQQIDDFDWTLCMKRIKLLDILRSGDTPEKRLEYIKLEIAKHCDNPNNKKGDSKDCFQFRSKCITMREDWEASLVVQVNSHFDQIGVLNNPQVSNTHNPRYFFLYSTKASEIIKSRVRLQKDEFLSIDTLPFIIKRLPQEGLIQHGRNSQLKKDMYYIVQPPGFGGYGQCLKLDKHGYEVTPQLQISIANNHVAYNQFDIWCYQKPYMKGQPTVSGTIDEEEHIQQLQNDNRCVLQICSIDTLTLQLELMSKIPRKVNLNRYDYVVKSSDTFQQQQGQWPFFAYNLGIEKIALIHLTRQTRIREYIYKVKEGHKFLCFVEFNSYQDIGFFAEGLLIEGCARISFITEYQDSIHLNLLLVDPYHKPMQFCYFISSYVIPMQDFKCEDMIEACYIIPSKRSQEVVGKDKEFHIYLITQYKRIIKRSKFKQDDPQALQDDDSDFGMNFSDFYIDKNLLGLTKQQSPFLEQVYMQLDEKNFLYYVLRSGSVCKIMEINPKKSKMRYHTCIYELKAEQCYGLSASRNGKQFIFIDESKSVFVLERLVDSRKLKLVSENHMNETFESDFHHKQYDPQIIQPDYIISSNKIFYLWKDDPYPNGIFMMENLSENEKLNLPKEFHQDIKWFQGPIPFIGSNQFGAVDRVRKFYAYLKVMTLPDSTTKTIMVDNTNQIDMSTFLENGDILLRCGHRYLIFDCDGFFKNQASFGDYEDKKGENSFESLPNNLKNKDKKNKNLEKDNDHIYQGLIEYGLQDGGNSSDEFETKQGIGQHNKNELLQFSTDNTKFLFLNRLSGRMKVYELKQILNKDKNTENWQFQKMYSLDQKNSELLKDTKKFMHGENKFQFRDYLEKCLTINVENDGSVIMMLISQPDRTDDENMAAIFFEVVISIFRVEFINKRYKVITQNVKKQYHRPDSKEIEQCYQYELDYHEQKIVDNQMVQDRYPAHQKDRTENDIIHDTKQYLEDRRRRLIHGINSSDLVIFWQGAWLKWTKITSDKNGIKLGDQPQKIEVCFNEYCEILRVIHTKVDNTVRSGFQQEENSQKDEPKEIIQILVKQHSIDQYDNKYIILTWDIIKDEQISIIEVEDENNEMLEFNLIKGMHIKLNYFQNKFAILDLDSTVPIQVVRNMEDQADHRSYINILRLILKFDNQRKVFEDKTRYLQIMRPKILVQNYSYLHMRKWRDIQYKKNKLNLFKAVVSFSDFMVDFDGQSLFHIYVKKSDVIQFIHDKYMEKKRANKLTKIEEILPLFIMNVDDQNYTALFRCIQHQNYKSFELLVSMLSGINNVFIAKNIIRSLPVMLSSESDTVLQYFDQNLYTPMQYQEPLMLPWPESQDDKSILFFPTNTTVLSPVELLEQLMNNKRVEKVEVYLEKEEEEEQEVLEDEETKLQKKIEEMDKEINKQKEIHEGNKNLRKRVRENILITQVEDNSLTAVLKDEQKQKEAMTGDSKNKRVIVRIIDFDFIFQNQNSRTLINILATQANSKVLKKKSIKAFITLMWSEYQQAIFWNAFMLYVIYMLSFIDLCGNTLPNYWDLNKKNPHSQTPWVKGSIDIVISGSLLIWLGKFELEQFMGSDFFDYFSSPWNVVDALQMVFNSIILVYSIFFLLLGIHIVDQQNIVTLAAYGSCLMWLKMFYWMRLFQPTAKYVNLIMQTLQDLTFFMVMVIIIIITFATFFFIINNNAVNVGISYVPDYGLSSIVNAFISTYFITIGEFSYDSFSSGPNVISCWIMFGMATFFNCVVFMNMLVAIMSQTFSECAEAEEESGLHEQVSMISDYVSLINHEETWKHKRYIFSVQVVEQGQEEGTNVRDLIASIGDNFNKKTERLHSQQQKKLNLIEQMLDNQAEQLAEIKQFMSQIISSVKQSNEEEDSFQSDSQDQSLEQIFSQAQEDKYQRNDNSQFAQN